MPDSVASVFCASANVFTGDVFHMNTMLIERVDAPDPVELGGLEAHALRAELLVERHGRRADADDGAVLRRTLKTWFTARKLPAPGMFLGTTVGLPGMCLPMWRARIRPQVSLLPPGG